MKLAISRVLIEMDWSSLKLKHAEFLCVGLSPISV